MPSSSRSFRRQLVAELERKGTLRSAAVRRAFLRVPRELFVPEVAAKDGLTKVYADQVHVTRTAPGGMPISSSSQPGIMAEMLERLDLRPGLRVLEIGAGTGYNAALLSTMVGPSGEVTTVDVEAELVAKASAALRQGGFDNVRVVVADGLVAVHGGAPYDRIILTASSDHVARPWFDQLVPGGLLELPLRMGPPGGWEQLVVTFRKEDDRLRSVSVVWGGFMPLRSPHEPLMPQTRSQVSISETIDGQYRVFGEVIGRKLAAMPADARRRMAGLLLSSPVVRTVPTLGPPGLSLVMFTAYAEPPAGIAVGYVRHASEQGMAWGAGVASDDGRSLAVVIGGGTGSSERRARLEHYGEPEAMEALRAIVDEWRTAGRPDIDDWRIEASFDGSGGRGDGADRATITVDRGA